MPYINWKARDTQKRLDAHEDARSTLSLDLSEEERGLLLPFLDQLFFHAGSELRLDLPNNWIVFWKIRETESRLLLAHPQQGEWVATMALETEHGQRVKDRIENLKSGDAFSISELGVIGSVSNVELVISLR
jgi:hypothetical protein